MFSGKRSVLEVWGSLPRLPMIRLKRMAGFCITLGVTFFVGKRRMNAPFLIRELCRSDAANLGAVLALHDAAHALECAWLNTATLPLLWRGTADIAASPLRILAAYDATGGLCGVLALARAADGSAEVVRLLVLPSRLGEGWGGRLLTALLADEHRVTAQTAAANTAALRCYHKAGFVRGKDVLAGDGLPLAMLHWQRDDSPLLLTLDDKGWVNEARQQPSPNCDSYPQQSVPLLVIHNISLPPYQYGGDGVVQLFSNSLDPDAHPYYAAIAHLRVSAHFFIRRDGSLWQFVSTRQRAWHAGVSQWRGRERCNDFALGVELEGCDFEPFCHAQYRTLAALAQLLQQACGISAISGHEHIAPGRKTDPGPYFDWSRLAASVGRALPEV